MSLYSEVVAWFARVEGKYIDMDNKYGAQCVDLAKHYAVNVHGVPNTAYGNGLDVAKNLALLPGWSFIPPSEKALPGDVVSWGQGWGVINGRTYGHVAVVLEDTGDRLVVLQQNPGAPSKGTNSKNGLVGYARPPRRQEEAASASRVHVVHPGETFATIAEQYDISAKALMSAYPNIKPENLQVGQRLTIPSNFKTHTVRSGDTFWKIAEKYGLSTKDVMLLNPTVPATSLRVGQSIRVS